MNISNNKIQYVLGNSVKTFKIPKEDQHINFKKWSYNDVIEYIKLNEKRKSKQPSKKNTKNKIKYQRLTTVKDNMIIKGKKTVDELKNDYVLAVNKYGANSIQAKSILEQLNEYGSKILKEYYKDYLNSLPINSNFNLTEEQFITKINEGAKHIIVDAKCVRIKNDNSTGMNDFEVDKINYSNSYNFINVLGYGSKIIKGFNDRENYISD